MITIAPTVTLTERQIKYREYLQSDHWKNLRTLKLQKAKHRCAICRSKGLIDVHHLNYKNLTDVETSDLRVLCRRCHDLAHELLRSRKLIYASYDPQKRFEQTRKSVLQAIGRWVAQPPKPRPTGIPIQRPTTNLFARKPKSHKHGKRSSRRFKQWRGWVTRQQRQTKRKPRQAKDSKVLSKTGFMKKINGRWILLSRNPNFEPEKQLGVVELGAGNQAAQGPRKTTNNEFRGASKEVGISTTPRQNMSPTRLIPSLRLGTQTPVQDAHAGQLEPTPALCSEGKQS